MQSVHIEFQSHGSRIHGRFFASAVQPASTLILVPGWPGNLTDVLGLGALLSDQGIHVLTFNPRGMGESEGIASFSSTLQDIEAALHWLCQPHIQEQFGVDHTRLALGGHSYGGGMALAYAAGDPTVRRIIAIASTDHAVLCRAYAGDPTFAAGFRRHLLSTRAPVGPVRFEMESVLQELALHQDVYGLRENAAMLADRALLLIGGWEDAQTPVEQHLLPFYRALKRAGMADVTFLMYHANHDFAGVREHMACDIHRWLLR